MAKLIAKKPIILPPVPMNSCTGRPLENFRYFRQLPFELRRMIWILFFPAARSIEIAIEFGKVSARPDEVHSGVSALPPKSVAASSLSQYQPPITLHINRESRLETLEVFRPFLRPEVNNATTPIYYDPKIDSISFGSQSYEPRLFREVRAISPSDLDQVKLLRVDSMAWNAEIRTKFEDGAKSELGNIDMILRYFHGFTKLTVKFYETYYANDTEVIDKGSVEECEKGLVAYFEIEKAMLSDAHAPAVEAIPAANWRF